VRPLPRLHAFTNHDVLEAPDYRVRLAAIAAVGPAVALHARDRQASDRVLTEVTTRMLAHARPPEAATFVNARADIAAALGAQGVQLGGADLSPRDARKVYPDGWIGASVHSESEARQAIDEGADFLVAGSTIFWWPVVSFKQTPTPTSRHPAWNSSTGSLGWGGQ